MNKDKLTMEVVTTLFDDESVRTKIMMMDKWEALFDDARNPTIDMDGQVEEFLELGNKYRVTLIIEKIK